MTIEQFEEEKHRAVGAVEYALNKLSGKGIVDCFDQEPTRKYSIGILSPQQPENDQTGKTSNRRSPSSVGIEATVSSSTSISLDVNLKFAVYWRAIPTWAEQLEIIPSTARENIEKSEGETRLRLKYHREEIEIGPVNVFISSISSTGIEQIDVSNVNIAIKDRIDAVIQKIGEDSSCWPANTKELPVPIKILENEARYKEYVASHLKQKTPEKPKWVANFSLRFWPQKNGNTRFAALLSNVSEENKEAKHPLSLVSSEFSISLKENAFQSSPFAVAAIDYRYSSVSWGRGINCVLTVSEDEKEARTETAPIFYQQRTMTRTEMNSACSFERLSGNESMQALSEVKGWLETYADKWRKDNENYLKDSSYAVRMSDLGEFEAEVTRFSEGINTLYEDQRLAEAFKNANKAFAKGKHPGWRLFQLVFVVSQLTSILAREKKSEELLAALNRVDVLWFPTGGGKTEAYFGVIATALFYDRLRGKDRGVTAWLRYPLRMLSIQQLQRLMEIVVYADEVRKASGNPVLTKATPFTLGYYVGEKNTPNSLTNRFDKPANKKLIELKKRVEEANDSADNPLLVLQRCPYCTSDDLGIIVEERQVRIIHHCNSCNRDLPIYITDTEIYRYTPSIIVGTVDRLARAGQTSQFAHIFGRANRSCPDHGLVNFNECLESAVCSRKPSEYIEHDELYDPCPALLLQDELHLLRESLGTYDSHYETFIDLLASKIGNGLPTKRLAATATIEGYKNHISELYARDAIRFPVKGMGDNESAYVSPSVNDPQSRIYVGVLPTGSETKEVVGSILTSLKEYADSLHKDTAGSGNAKQYLEDNYDLSLAYVNQKNTAGDLRSNWNDSDEVQVLTGDRGLAEVRATIGRVESDKQRKFSERLKFLIATSVISHGVDLERLNFMAFAGLPSAASDYIQASSRVGRTHLGVVFTVFRPENNRERNVYQRFYEFHERLYQLVQPIPINRVSQSAISRTITGILGACILNILGYELGQKQGGFDKGKTFATALSDGTVSDEELIDLSKRAFGLERVQLPGDSLAVIDEHIIRLVKDERRLMQQEEDFSTSRRMRPHPVSSLREVSEQVGFALTYQSAEVVTRLLQGKVKQNATD